MKTAGCAAAGAAMVAAWLAAVPGEAGAQPTMTRLFLRGKDFAKYLDEEYAATRTVMADLGLVK